MIPALPDAAAPWDLELLRRAVLTSIPRDVAQWGPVAPKYVYLPLYHSRALDPDAMVVTGIRGAGKSFWWRALQEPDLRSYVLRGSVEVTPGWSSIPDRRWPDKHALLQSFQGGIAPEVIWRSVVLRALAPDGLPEEWNDFATWTRDHPSAFIERLQVVNDALAQRGQRHVVVFDALDLVADDRRIRTELLRGLLQLALGLRGFSALRAKIFVRPDLLHEGAAATFADSSKVLASRVDLRWVAWDLYGLVYQYLGNADDEPAALEFRRLYAAFAGHGHALEVDPVMGWRVSPARIFAPGGPPDQRVFEALAGPYMGADARRGRTFSWLPNHLADALALISPRSFLVAIRGAAEHPLEPGQTTALHWRGLQQGVRLASEYRASELPEDFEWADMALRALAGLTVPCTREEIRRRWREKGLGDEHHALYLGAMEAVGFFAALEGDRINIPDVYRVSFGLRRKGGLRPAHRRG